MTQSTRRALDENSLVELLDRLIETGVVATGDVILGLADVDLVRVNLRLVLAAVDAFRPDDEALATQPADVTATAPTTPSTPAMPSTSRTHRQPTATSTTARSGDTPAPNTAPPPNAAPPPNTAALAPSANAAAPLDLPERSDLGIGGLLVAVIEILHRLLERQAIHRMERGSLTSDQIERLGQALMALDQRVNQLIEIFSTRSTPALPVAVAGAAH